VWAGAPPRPREESTLYGDELPFTGIGSAILTASAVVVTAVGAVLAFASGPIAAALGGLAAVATRIVNRPDDDDDLTP
jgi:hypothetical protein